MQTSSDGSRIDFFYDDKGNVFAMKYQERQVMRFWELTVTERNL